MNKKFHGVTLIELLVVMAILGIVLSVIIALYFAGVRSYISTENRITAQQSARFAMEYIVREIRSVNDSTKIEVRDDKTIVVDGKRFYYSPNKKSLCLDDDSHEIANYIEDFQVSYDQSKKIIKITIISKEGSDTYSLTSTLSLRR